MKKSRYDVDYGPETRLYREIMDPTPEEHIKRLEHMLNCQGEWIAKAQPELERALKERQERIEAGVRVFNPQFNGEFNKSYECYKVRMKIDSTILAEDAEKFLSNDDYRATVCEYLARRIMGELDNQIRTKMEDCVSE